MTALDVLIRLGAAVAIIALGLLAYQLLNRAILQRAQQNGAAEPQNLPAEWRGVPAILYFTTPDCAPCKTVQRPALRRLQNDLGERLQVIEIDACERPDLAARWGVLSVPTTFILDANGRLLHVNHGATRAEALREQLKGIL